LSHPAATVEYHTRRRLRTRVHVEPHEFLDGYTVLKFTDAAADTVFEFSFAPDELRRFMAGLADHVSPAVIDVNSGVA
jgi:hypothetical protein